LYIIPSFFATRSISSLISIRILLSTSCRNLSMYCLVSSTVVSAAPALATERAWSTVHLTFGRYFLLMCVTFSCPVVVLISNVFYVISRCGPHGGLRILSRLILALECTYREHYHHHRRFKSLISIQ
jgi:hypothetical protein